MASSVGNRHPSYNASEQEVIGWLGNKMGLQSWVWEATGMKNMVFEATTSILQAPRKLSPTAIYNTMKIVAREGGPELSNSVKTFVENSLTFLQVKKHYQDVENLTLADYFSKEADKISNDDAIVDKTLASVVEKGDRLIKEMWGISGLEKIGQEALKRISLAPEKSSPKGVEVLKKMRNNLKEDIARKQERFHPIVQEFVLTRLTSFAVNNYLNSHRLALARQSRARGGPVRENHQRMVGFSASQISAATTSSQVQSRPQVGFEERIAQLRSEIKDLRENNEKLKKDIELREAVYTPDT